MTTLLTERECIKCGITGYAPANNSCPSCGSIMHRVVTPIPSKRLSGVLCRDPDSTGQIVFVPGASLLDLTLLGCGMWNDPTRSTVWSRKRWIEQYGKLPRKGSKEMVLLELSNDR